MKSHVAIGPEFFRKARNDYANWTWALIREFLQNSIDAPNCSEIEVNIIDDGGFTKLEVLNNGQPMDQEILVGKLLSLGGSGKNFTAGAVGGFGKAKELLYFCHEEYLIHTGRLLVRGSGAVYEIEETEQLSGTRSVIRMTGELLEPLSAVVKQFAAFAKWKGTLRLNGDPLECDLRNGRKCREFPWGTVYVSNHETFGGVLVVRIGGIPMFVRSHAAKKKLVVVELSKPSGEVLQSSRDNLLCEPACNLSDFLQEIAVDKRSALRAVSSTVDVFDGSELVPDQPQVVAGESGSSPEPPAVQQRTLAVAGLSARDLVRIMTVSNTSSASHCNSMTIMPVTNQNVLGYKFLMKNNTGRNVPSNLRPDRKMSRYGRLLAKGWSQSLLAIWQMFGETQRFTVGFIFDDDRAAEYEFSNVHGHVFYINPFEAKADGFRRRQRAWKFRRTRWQLVTTAIHEFVHYRGFRYHDEDFTSYSTLVVEPVVMFNLHRFARCFSLPSPERRSKYALRHRNTGMPDTH